MSWGATVGSCQEVVIVACATALPAHTAILRLSGTDAVGVATRAGLRLAQEREIVTQDWPLAGGTCPVRVWRFAVDRSFTGEETVELALPGAPDLVALALTVLTAAGAQAAARGDFARRALAHGRLSLDRVEALLAVAEAGDAAAAQAAIARLRARLADELAPMREQVLHLRALLEAGLDFAEEDGVIGLDPRRLHKELLRMRDELARWQIAGGDIGAAPVVALVGPANAGKSSLFHFLSGADALVSPIPGTTRDVLEADWILAGRSIRLIDTAGWMAAGQLTAEHALDAEAIAAGRAAVAGATLILACTAPDAPLPAELALPLERTVVVATKADVHAAAAQDPRAVVACSTATVDGCADLVELIRQRLASSGGASTRQSQLLATALAVVQTLIATPPHDDVLLADDLVRLADLLGDIIGATTADDVLNHIFSKFCIGK